MNSIIEAMYGGGAGSKVIEPNTAKSPANNWYGSFEYFSNPDAPPPPASEGGPTAMQIAEAEGFLDANGMLSNGMSPIVAAMYGGGIAPISSGTNSMNPDYQAGLFGDTVGGIGNTDAWYQDIYWSAPQGGQAQEGTIFETPAGNYMVQKNPWGQYVLVPQEGAIQSNGPYTTNLYSGRHHLGINPETGEVWYQEAAGYNNFDRDNPSGSFYQNPNAPIAPTNPDNPNYNGGGNGGGSNSNPSNNASGQGSTWQEVLQRGGKSLESWDPFLGMFTGLDSNPEWTSLSPAQVESTFWNLFGDLANANEVYQRLLENLGLA